LGRVIETMTKKDFDEACSQSSSRSCLDHTADTRRSHRSGGIAYYCTAPLEPPPFTTMSLTTSARNPRILALFDVDGTLTLPRGEITASMLDFMTQLSQEVTVGIVGGSDLPKQEEQLGEGIVRKFPWNFSQNGLVAYKNGELLEVQTIAKHIGEDNVKRIVNWVLKYVAELDIPVKVRTRSEKSVCNGLIGSHLKSLKHHPAC